MSEESKPIVVCIIPACGKEQRWKGLCSKCYGQAKRLIDDHKTTWETLNDLGLAVIPPSPFMSAFLEKTKTQ